MNENQLPPIAALVSEYLDQNKPRWTFNTSRAADLEMRRFAQFIGTRELRPRLVADYQAEQYARKCGDEARHKTLAWTNRFLEWCGDMDYLMPNRFRGLLTVPTATQIVPIAFTHVQYEALKEASLGTMWYYAIIMAYRTGTRYSDTALMKWAYVNLEEHFIQYVPYKSRKTGRRAVCPFEAGGDLHSVLLDLSESRHPHPLWHEYVCPEMAMTYPQSEGDASRNRRRDFDRLRKQIGAPKGMSFHNLRNSFMTRLVQSGTPSMIGMQITGLSKESILTRYAKPDLSTLRKAIEGMSKNDNPPDEGSIIKLPAA